MSENQETRIVKTRAQKALAFVETNPDQLAGRLKLMIVGGRNLADAEAKALATYSVATGLNPFTGECYYLPGIGPGPGIAGWRVKASEQLEYECQLNRIPTAMFWCEPIKLGKGEFDGDPEAGDVGYKMVLHDGITKRLWEEAVLARSIRIKNELGADLQTSWDMAMKLVGPEPTWEGIGVVHAAESFSGTDQKGNKKPEMWDRNERAQKRGEKLAIRKRFPRVYLPEPLGFEPDIIDSTFVEVPKEKREPAQILAEMGIETPPQPEPEQAPEPEAQPEVETPQVKVPPTNVAPPLAALIEAKVCPNVADASFVFTLLKGDKIDIETLVKRGKIYRGWRDKGEKDKNVAAAKAIAGEIPN